MRMDESEVPMFPIYGEEGQHGFIERTRYPKAGDKNPEVKVGVVAPDGGATVWADFNQKDDQYFGMPLVETRWQCTVDPMDATYTGQPESI
jgi:dipeptidyl-peptidase 4